MHLAGDLLEGAYRLLARRCPTVVVGPDIARNYASAPAAAAHLRVARERVPARHAGRGAGGDRRARPLEAFTVGRLETEKNPLMLADVVARLDPRWRLDDLRRGAPGGRAARRLRELGIEDRVQLRGYLPVDGGLMDLYRSSDAFLHVSWTEGVPQVLLEAFAAGSPVVATAVGGVPDMAGDAALLVPPGDPDAAAAALNRLADEPGAGQRARRARTGAREQQDPGGRKCARSGLFGRWQRVSITSARSTCYQYRRR